MNVDSRHRMDSAQRRVKSARDAIYRLRVRLLSAAKAGRPLDEIAAEWALDSVDQELQAAVDEMGQAVVLDDARKETAA